MNVTRYVNVLGRGISVLALLSAAGAAQASLQTARWYFQGVQVSGDLHTITVTGSGNNRLTLIDPQGTVYADHTAGDNWKAIVCLPVDPSAIPVCVVQTRYWFGEYLTIYRWNGQTTLPVGGFAKSWAVAPITSGSSYKSLFWFWPDTNWTGGYFRVFHFATGAQLTYQLPGGYYSWYSPWVPRQPEARLPVSIGLAGMGSYNAVDFTYNVPNPGYDRTPGAPNGIYRYNNGSFSWIR